MLHNASVPQETRGMSTRVTSLFNHKVIGFSPKRNFHDAFLKIDIPTRNTTAHRKQQPSLSGWTKTESVNLADSFLRISNHSNYSILQFADLYNRGKEDREGIQMIGTVAERVKPNLVILTGNILDTRYCRDYKNLRNVVQPLIDLGIPWTFVPGNDPKTVPRTDLLNVYKMPLCALSNGNSFTHSIKLGPVQIHLIDSSTMNPTNGVYDFIQNQTGLSNKAKIEGELGLAFFHSQKPKIIIGNRVPQYNPSASLNTTKKGEVNNALFTGAEHWNDFVSEMNGTWLAYGRVSGAAKTSLGGSSVPLKKERGSGRVIRYDSSKKILSSWLENRKGFEHNTLISKAIAVDQSVVDQ